MSKARALLEEYVTTGKLMQLTTLNADGSPVVCNLWYDPHFTPDLLRWISRHDRQHSRNLATDPRIAGAIIAIPLTGLGQTVRGVSFTGHARELPTQGIDRQIDQFLTRWPAAATALDPALLANGQSPIRLYEATITGWVLFDEEHFPHQPRQEINSQ